MASNTPPRDTPRFGPESNAASLGETLRWLLAPLASLKLTVALFAMAIFLIFTGTLAQVDQDIWEVMRNYFRTFFAWIPFQVFFARPFFIGEPPQVPGEFWFPGGFLIGGAMAANLLAAHSIRFTIVARGARLLAGLATIAIGVALTWQVVAGGSDKEILEGGSEIDWSTSWTVIKLALGLAWFANVFAVFNIERGRRLERGVLIVSAVGLGALLGWLLYEGQSAELSGPAMRILWQLAKAGMVGVVLLGGCALLFRKRAGIVLLHAGVLLMMGNELVVYKFHVEGQMPIAEGQTIDWAQDTRTFELAITRPKNADEDDVVVVPQAVLLSEEPIQSDELPCDIEMNTYFRNSAITRAGKAKDNPATAGDGLEWIATEERPVSGADAEGKVDVASAYITLRDKQTSQELATYLVSVGLPEQQVELGGKKYELALRFKRMYKPYSMHLYDFRFDKYLGTETAKNFSSELRLVDPSRGVDRKVNIRMNEPLRFAGETFYQSGHHKQNGKEVTVLQVVTNAGWMVPYVACMIVVTGLLAHFSITLTRFLKRRSASESEPIAKEGPGRWSPAQAWFPLTVVLSACLGLANMARPPVVTERGMQIHEFGKLPLVYEGRVKPFDTLARNSLVMISNRQTFVDENKARQPAIKWLLDVITLSDDAMKHKVFRIENLEVLELFGLERRSGFLYSLDEMRPKFDEFQKQVELAGEKDAHKLNTFERKALELRRKLRVFQLLSGSFRQPSIRPENFMEDFQRAAQMQQALAAEQPPLAVPPLPGHDDWESYTSAWLKEFVRVTLERAHEKSKTELPGMAEPNPALDSLTAILVAYGDGKASAFNRAVADYQNMLEEHPPADLEKVAFEVKFNQFEPFFDCVVLYTAAFVLCAFAWLGFSGPLNRAAFWLLTLAFVVHTAALIARIYISGRPPVTNLYSSAVFIGWAGAGAGLILERIFRLGIGNVIAAVDGIATLWIAHILAARGDTLPVLQAVLDTQFWLATHVTCVTLGYAATFVAGLLGVLYILRGVLTPSLPPVMGKQLSRMIYGTVCFAMFFSFFGTVLGGLWADDSWGRFWGWDPKENGALIIVLWNALILHARWGGMVKDRGLAALAVVGNIVTSWSWFGVNELGIGLHSYGFTEGVLLTLAIFIASQLAIVALAALPKSKWRSAVDVG